MSLARTRLAMPMALCALLCACASAPVKPPTLQVAGLKVGDIGLTGVALELKFRVRNPNQGKIKIERFEYDLTINGQRMGKGFEANGLAIEPFQDQEVVSRFDLNLLSLPGAVKSVLGEKAVAAHVEGVFYIKGQSPLPFSSDAQIDLARK